MHTVSFPLPSVLFDSRSVPAAPRHTRRPIRAPPVHEIYGGSIRGPPLLQTDKFQPQSNRPLSVPGEPSRHQGKFPMELRQLVSDHDRQIFATCLAQARATRGVGFKETTRSVLGKAHIQYGNLYAIFDED